VIFDRASRQHSGMFVSCLIIDTSFPYIEYLPKPGDCRCIQIDANAQRIGLRTPVEVGLVG
jgi:pyruvate dehydrogenase (quinone)